MIRLIVFFSLFFSGLAAEENANKNDILYTNLIGAAVITTWGLVNWDYAENPPHREDERWFQRTTDSGGADKLGHLYASYLVGSGLSHLYENWGYNRDDAALYGSLSSFFLMTYMEVGDAFSSDLGFSYEDFLMNTLGSFSSYLFYVYPELSKRVDFRIEYIPSFKRDDIVTEYERMKYLVAFKAEGFDFVSNPYLRYTELHLGYYTRNYHEGFSSESERVVYLGIGINLSRIARQNSYAKTASFLNYYQLPYTYLPVEKDMNR